MNDPPRRSADSPRRAAAIGVVRALRQAGHMALLAGGCVRDELLGIEPGDYDVATDATPDRIAALFRRASHVGASFGVVIVRAGPARDAPNIEVATFRSDGAYSDRRRPDEVRFSDPRSDACRRDFTINALFLDPIHDPNRHDAAAIPSGARFKAGPMGGTVVDYVGGLDDLSAGILRAVGDAEQRLAEDHLRALRAVRLSARLGFAIEPATERAIIRHASELRGISRERIGDEIRRMLSSSRRAHAVGLIDRLGLASAVLDLPPGAGEATVRSVADPSILGLLPAESSIPTCLAGWAMDRARAGLEPAMDNIESYSIRDPAVWQGVPSPGVLLLGSRWRKALCLSNDERDSLNRILHWAGMVAFRWDSMQVAHRCRTAAAEWFEPAMSLLRAGVQSGMIIRTDIEHIEREVRYLKARPGGIAPTPLVNGDDLANAGFRPGPSFRVLLEAIYDAQLESRFRTREDGLELARSLSV